MEQKIQEKDREFEGMAKKRAVAERRATFKEERKKKKLDDRNTELTESYV
jgi:hypothetical protein